MLQSKPRRPRRPTKLEKALEQVARLMADREAASVPWPQLQEVRENYVAWEALTLWVRAIEDVEGSLPRWLAEVVERCCPGFSEFVAKRQQQRSNSSPFWHDLQSWINEPIFHKSWQEGWMDAVGYYAARDLASLRNHAYWEYVSASGSSQSLLLIPLSATGLKPRSSVTTRRSTSAKCARRNAD